MSHTIILTYVSKYTLSAPNFDLLKVAPMSLCTIYLVIEDAIDLIDSMANSKTDDAGVLKDITVFYTRHIS